MHCLLLGVEKRLINFFCDPSYSKCKFYITKKNRELLNKRIRPNREVVRKPRSLEIRSKFKASEFRSILLYYFPVCLAGLVPNVYVEHVRLLSAATYILLKSTITRQEIDEAEKMLHRFVAQHEQLFGKENMVMNIHLLKHLAHCLRSLGPMWCHSAFPFERNNGVLLKKVNGTTDVLLQVSSKYCLSKAIMNCPAKSIVRDRILLGRSVKFIEKSLRVFNIERLKEVDLSNKQLYVHKRINLKNVIFTSTSYTLPKKSVDYFIGLQNDMIGKVKFYFESNSKIYVVLEEFEIVDYIDHILKVEPTRRNILTPANEIEQKYLYMKVGFHQYICSVIHMKKNEENVSFTFIFYN